MSIHVLFSTTVDTNKTPKQEGWLEEIQSLQRMKNVLNTHQWNGRELYQGCILELLNNSHNMCEIFHCGVNLVVRWCSPYCVLLLQREHNEVGKLTEFYFVFQKEHKRLEWNGSSDSRRAWPLRWEDRWVLHSHLNTKAGIKTPNTKNTNVKRHRLNIMKMPNSQRTPSTGRTCLQATSRLLWTLTTQWQMADNWIFKMGKGL